MNGAGNRSALLPRLVTLVAIFWMGSLWTICGVVAPALFATLDDRRLAGDIAGELFHIQTWIGVALGGMLSVLVTLIGAGQRKTGFWIGITALPPLLNELGLLPLMSAARAAGNMALFGMLHLGSVVLFGIACVGALILVLRLTRPAG